jgi:hypothetical protein
MANMNVDLPVFLHCLLTTGRVRVPLPADISEKEFYSAEEVLSTFEQQYRQEIPAIPPPICLPVARWAAVRFYRACQFIAFRDIDEETINRLLIDECPQGDLPSVHYSVDITFRFLPDLMKLAKTASPHDPLLIHLGRWAAQWPLSSVGMTDVEPMQIEPIVENECLLSLYVDRIIARNDTKRLADPRVRESARAAVGIFPEIAPKMADAINGECVL